MYCSCTDTGELLVEHIFSLNDKTLNTTSFSFLLMHIQIAVDFTLKASPDLMTRRSPVSLVKGEIPLLLTSPILKIWSSPSFFLKVPECHPFYCPLISSASDVVS